MTGPASGSVTPAGPGRPAIRVALVEDDPVQRDEILDLLHTARMQVVGAWPSAEAGLGGMLAAAPDVVLVDIGLPGQSGIDLVRRAKPRLPKTQFMILTVFEDTERIFSALEAGATGYLLKRTAPRRLIEAIQELHEGGSPMSGAIGRQVLQRLASTPTGSRTPAPEAALLSEREREVLDLLAQGRLYKEIGLDLGIAVGTVRTHIRRIYEKLHVRNRTEATRQVHG